jgi:hypothetical protein
MVFRHALPRHVQHEVVNRPSPDTRQHGTKEGRMTPITSTCSREICNTLDRRRHVGPGKTLSSNSHPVLLARTLSPLPFRPLGRFTSSDRQIDLEFLTLSQQSLFSANKTDTAAREFLADSKTPINTYHDRRGLDGATDGSTAPTKRCLSCARGRRYHHRPQQQVVLLVLLVIIWHDREMFGGHDGVRVDGFHNDGFDC